MPSEELVLGRTVWANLPPAFVYHARRRSDLDKDTEILILRHQIAVLQRQLGDQRVRFRPADRALLAALLHPLPRPMMQRLRLLVRPDTILRWHRDRGRWPVRPGGRRPTGRRWSAAGVGRRHRLVCRRTEPVTRGDQGDRWGVGSC
jgi:hypothetical protein